MQLVGNIDIMVIIFICNIKLWFLYCRSEKGEEIFTYTLGYQSFVIFISLAGATPTSKDIPLIESMTVLILEQNAYPPYM